VCTSYRSAEGAELTRFPFHQTVLHHASPEYHDLPGWTEDISGVRSEEDLPDAARDYLRYVSEWLGVPIVLIGVGPGRDQVIWTGAAEGSAVRSVAV
jgi:adenylosuccinate synthase